MAATKKNTALALVENFQVVGRYEGLSPEMLAELKDEMEDLDPETGIACRQIKVPSGGGIAYEVQGEDDDDTDAMKEIEGVIVFTHRLSGYWPGAFGAAKEAKDKIPVCSSMDGKTGLNTETGELRECERCPWNEYGTGVDEKGNPSRGKACKNMRRLYLLMDGDPNLYLLTVPPTSIRDVNKQLTKILTGGVPYTGLVVKLKLEKVQNANGVAYSKVAISKSGLLAPDKAAAVMQLRQEVKAQYKDMAITAEDYAPSAPRGKAVDLYPSKAEAAAMDGCYFEEAPPHDDGDAPLPFA